MAYLFHLDGDGSVAQFWEVSDRPLLVGRGDFASACVADGSLSRAHFLILREGPEFFVVDLDSQNGTRMGGVPVSGRRLHEGDVIEAGESMFRFSRFAPGAQPLSPPLPVHVVSAQPRVQARAV